MAAAIQHEFKYVLNDSIQNTTIRFAGIQLLEQDVPLSGDVCTVHTILEGTQKGVLLICADRSLLTRLAQKIMHLEAVTPKDVEDVAKEYFNIVCGKVAGYTILPTYLPGFRFLSFIQAATSRRAKSRASVQ